MDSGAGLRNRFILRRNNGFTGDTPRFGEINQARHDNIIGTGS